MRPDEVPFKERSPLVRISRLFATRNPETFTEKVRYKMLRDRRRLLVTFADKAAVRAHVASVVGVEYLPRAYAIIDDPVELATMALPTEYVVKPTHGSGAVIVVSSAAPIDSQLPAAEHSWTHRHVRPSAVHRAHLVRIAEHWISQVYGQGPNREWAYGEVSPRIIAEELLTGPDDDIPDDVKLFVFHGRCWFIQLDSGRFSRRTQDFYDRDWTHLALSGGPPWADPPHQRPPRLAELIDVAERLGAGTDFVRVDLYIVGDRIVFGELTSYPAGGDSPFEPETFDADFGRPWRVPRRYR